MIRAFKLVCFASMLVLGAGSSHAADEPVSGFLKGLKAIATAYQELQAIVDSRIATLERQQLAQRMLRLADAFTQLRNDKDKLTRSIEAAERKPDYAFFETLLPDVTKLNQTIDCVWGNLNSLGNQIKISRLDGPTIEQNLRAGLQQKTAHISQMATSLGLPHPTDHAAALKSIKDESETAAKLADQLTNQSLDLARKLLDQNFPSPQQWRPCERPVSTG